MKLNTLFTALLLTALALPLSAQETPRTQSPPTILIDAIHNNGSFEKGTRGWSSHAHGCKVIDRGTMSDAPVPAGKQYAFITVTGNDKSRLDGRFEAYLNGIKQDKGNAFTLSFQAKTRSTDQYNAVLANLILQKYESYQDKDGKTKQRRVMAGVLTSKVINLKTTDWTPMKMDFTYDGDKPFDFIGVRISFLRMGATGSLIEGQCYLDDVVLTQYPAIAEKKSISQQVNQKSVQVKLTDPPIAINFELDKPGYVTLVLEDEQGHRVRNLTGGEFYEAGKHTFLYDGTDIGTPKQHAQPGTGYEIIRSIIKPGQYTVRGLVRDQIKLTYEKTIYPNTGNPPWPTDIDFGPGGWLADHGSPRAIAFIPESYSQANKPHLVITSGVAEAAQAVAWVDMDGNKFAGRRRIGGHWTGATLLAVDHGPKRDQKIYLYSAMSWNVDKTAKSAKPQAEIRIMGFADNGMFRVAFPQPTLPNDANWDDIDLGGLAVHNGLLVYSDKLTQKLYLYDAASVSVQTEAKPLGTIDLANAGGMYFDRHGKLFILVGNELHRYTLDVPNCQLTDKEILISDGLDQPRQLTVDSKGNFYITNQGESHCIKVFTANSYRHIKTIGHPGKPQSGLYDEYHMNNPDGIAIDARDQLWVTEDFKAPKRVSVWSLDGKLIKAFYGPPGYGGGGMIDPKDPSRFYLSQTAGGMEFKINQSTGQTKLDRIYWLASETPWYAPRWHGPQTVTHALGHRYITTNYSGPTTGQPLASIWRDDKERITPLACVGSLSSWKFIEEQGWLDDFPAYQVKGNPRKVNRQRHMFKASSLVCWVDLNHDQQVQNDEVQIRSFADDPNINSFLTAHIQSDLSLLITHRNGVVELKPTQVDSDGLPHYDLANVTSLVSDINHQPTSGGGQAFTDDSGMLIFTGGPMRGFKDGKLVWQYHSRWPGLHPGHASPALPSYPGELLATTRLLGPTVTPRNSDAGELWAINSDKGVVYLLTTDGLFVDYLGAYPRDGRQWDMAEHNRGMDLTNINQISEHFFPTLNQLPNGEIILVAGKSHSSLVKVLGLESIKRLPSQSLTITAKDVLAVQDYMIACDRAQKSASESDVMTITKSDKPKNIDGKLNDWQDPQWVLIDAETFKEGDWGKQYKEPAITAALSVDQSHLYIALLSRRNNLLDNRGSDLQTLFKTGGGFDLKLATQPVEGKRKNEPVAGDLRLLITEANGNPKAACYRYIVPGTQSPVAFTSPVRHITIDQIDDVSLQIKLASSRLVRPAFTQPEKKVVFDVTEIAIPLSVLGWNPKQLPKTTGDIGVLIGQSGATVERVYWHNKAAGIIADIPSEAMIMPAYWGKIQVK